jgi:hypothetical protein
VGELLGALGLAWPRLLLYPGGVFALAASWLLAAWLSRCAGRPIAPPGGPAAGALAAALPPLAAIALMPLAPARSFPFGLDLVIALALLEWPRALQGRALTRAAALREYGPLLLAAALLAEGAGGLELTRLLRAPESWLDRGLLAAGALLWLAALPRLLLAGPPGIAGRLRALGLLLVAALPLLGALAAALSELVPGELAGWVLPPTAMVIVALALGGALMPRLRCGSRRGRGG